MLSLFQNIQEIRVKKLDLRRDYALTSICVSKKKLV